MWFGQFNQLIVTMETCVLRHVSSSHDLDKADINSSFSVSLVAISVAENKNKNKSN